MSVTVAIVALVAAVIAFKMLTGAIKLVAILALLGVAAWFLIGGGA